MNQHGRFTPLEVQDGWVFRLRTTYSPAFPSRLFTGQWQHKAFVSITAAGQRGILTPLPRIHLQLKLTIFKTFSFVNNR